MNLKAKLIILSDKLDRLGLSKHADPIATILVKLSSEALLGILNEEEEEDQDTPS